VSERDYQARMNRLTRLAFHMDDEAAANEAIALAGRAGDHATGRRLLARFDREGVAAAVPDVPDNLKPIRHRGIQLQWGHPTAILYAACVAQHLLDIFEEAYPDVGRPRAAIEAARAYVRGDIDRDAARAAARAAAHAAYAAGAAANAAAYAAHAAAAAGYAAWAAAAAGSAAWAAAAAAYAAHAAAAAAGYAAWAAAEAAEQAWQRERLIDFLLGVKVNCE